ncbi:MAG TPA: dihydrofolate reductase family protein [Devosia sp.]|nr:dihydrofolate reductase family protein [Devosia sp.]
MSDQTNRDNRWLDAAVRLARPLRGAMTGRPAVAALVVDEAEDHVLVRSVTGPGGAPTAVIAAIADAGMNAHRCTLVITIEPTLEDAQMIVAAGFARVVIGVRAPEKGRDAIATLRQHGVDVVVADHAGAAEFHGPEIHRIKRRRPFTTLCLAVSADGMVSRQDGVTISLIGQEARDWLGMQRAFSDGVMIGGRTAELDDPELTPGLRGLDDRSYARIVAAGSRPLRPGLRLMRGGHPVYVLCERGKDFGLPPPVEFITLDDRNGRPDLRQGMTALAERGISALLVEGGAKLSEAMLAAEQVDRVHLIEAAVEVGRDGVPATVLGGILGRLRGAGFAEVESRELGRDRLRTYRWQF